MLAPNALTPFAPFCKSALCGIEILSNSICRPAEAEQNATGNTSVPSPMNPMILSQAAHTPRLDAFLPCKTHACHHAFSSGSVATTRRHARRCLIPRVNKQREGLVVCAAAATDVGAKAVQSIKKSVGGDVFVVGTAKRHDGHVARKDCSIIGGVAKTACQLSVLTRRWRWSTRSTDRAGTAT